MTPQKNAWIPHRSGHLSVFATTATQHGTGPGQSIAVEPVGYENPRENSSYLTWESTNESVATVDPNGVITALTPGDAQVSASYKWADDVTDTVRVQVRSVSEETGIELPESALTVAGGRQLLVNALLAPSLQGSHVSWALDSSSVGTLTTEEDRPTATVHATAWASERDADGYRDDSSG